MLQLLLRDGVTSVSVIGSQVLSPETMTTINDAFYERDVSVLLNLARVRSVVAVFTGWSLRLSQCRFVVVRVNS